MRERIAIHSAGQSFIELAFHLFKKRIGARFEVGSQVFYRLYFLNDHPANFRMLLEDFLQGQFFKKHIFFQFQVLTKRQFIKVIHGCPSAQVSLCFMEFDG